MLVVATSCAPPPYQYVKSPIVDGYFRIPRDWTLYGSDLLKQAARRTKQSPQEQARTPWQVVFDASPSSSVDTLSDDLAPYPPNARAGVSTWAQQEFKRPRTGGQ